MLCLSRRRLSVSALAVSVAMIVIATPVLAHTGQGDGHGLAAGLAHPLLGLDHVLAMVAVGLWAALRGEVARWQWPLAFVGGMLSGFIGARYGLTVPALETLIVGTVIALGAVLAFGLSAPLAAGAGLLALFGATHGVAHGLEIDGAALPFAAGFTLATAALHCAGVGIGIAMSRFGSRVAARLAGAGVMLAGLALAAGIT